MLQKVNEDMEHVKQEDVMWNKEAEFIVTAMGGAILLDRENPNHRIWMEEEE